jgi:hypothetical protein
MEGCYKNNYSFYGRCIMMRKLLILTTMMMIMMSISALSVGAAVEPSGDGVENLVVLLTDYGTTDFYVGALEGSIYSTNPEARISTITHEVPAFNVAEGVIHTRPSGTRISSRHSLCGGGRSRHRGQRTIHSP